MSHSTMCHSPPAWPSGPSGASTAASTGSSLLTACDLHQQMYDLAANAKAPVKAKDKVWEGEGV